MEAPKEKPKTVPVVAIERIARLNRELFGDEVVIIDATGKVPHKIEPSENSESSAA